MGGEGRGGFSCFHALRRLRRDASMSTLDLADSMETAEEQRVHSPPASLVPRLHVLHARRLPHNNPLLPAATPEGGTAGKSVAEVTRVAFRVRAKVE